MTENVLCAMRQSWSKALAFMWITWAERESGIEYANN